MKPPAVGGLIALAVVAGRPNRKSWRSVAFRQLRGRSVAAQAVPQFNLADEQGHLVQLVRPRFCLGAGRAACADLGGGRFAHLVAVSIPIRPARSGPWVDYRRRSGQCDRSTCARRRRRLSRPARVWPSFFCLQYRRRGHQCRGGAFDSRPRCSFRARRRVKARGARPVGRSEIAKNAARCAASRNSSSNSRNWWRDTPASKRCRDACGGKRYRRWALVCGQQLSRWR